LIYCVSVHHVTSIVATSADNNINDGITHNHADPFVPAAGWNARNAQRRGSETWSKSRITPVNSCQYWPTGAHDQCTENGGLVCDPRLTKILLCGRLSGRTLNGHDN
jgi:hypothetical protein